MEDVGRPTSRALQKQRSCTICGMKGHIARGHPAWEERERKRIEKETSRKARADAAGQIVATSRQRKRKSRGRRNTRADIDDTIEETPDIEGERLDEIGGAESEDSGPDDDVGDVNSLQPWTQLLPTHLSELTTRSTEASPSFESTIPMFEAGRHAHFGPTNVPEVTSTPGQFFALFFTDELLDEFVTATNAFAADSLSFSSQLP